MPTSGAPIAVITIVMVPPVVGMAPVTIVVVAPINGVTMVALADGLNDAVCGFHGKQGRRRRSLNRWCSHDHERGHSEHRKKF